MALTENPLHKFNSYSYHHILIACDSTETAAAVSNLNASENNNTGTFFTDVYSKRGASVGNVEALDSSNGGKYVVVINGAKDAEFVIDNAKWQTLITPYIPSIDPNTIQATSIALEGSFDVIEPRGVQFLNVINDVGVILDTGPTGITWLLKTVFIGQIAGPTPKVQYITNINPLMFFMINIAGNFNESGSEYLVTFVGQSNGVSKMSQYSKLSLGNTSFASDNRTLPEVLGAIVGDNTAFAGGGLVSKIQATYNEYVTKTEQAGTGREIKYEIRLDSKYENYVVDQLQLSQSGRGSGGGGINFGTIETIEQAISKVMLMSDQVKADAKASPKSIFKVYSSLRTTNTEAIVTYFVKSYKIPESGKLGGEPNTGINNILEYDYIFTGKNIDILKFDIRMEMGLAFFKLLESSTTLTSNQVEQTEQEKDRKKNEQTKPDGTQTETDVGVNTGAEKQTEHRNKSKRIIFPGQEFEKKFQRNHKDTLNNMNFQAALSKHAALENLEANITIHGNPNILNDVNIAPFQITDGQIQGNELFPDFLVKPVLCKVNVMMPANNSLTGASPSKFSQSFWYKGYYSIIFIEHEFKRGVFTQTFDMMSIPEE
jgi:hypothetical protein